MNEWVGEWMNEQPDRQKDGRESFFVFPGSHPPQPQLHPGKNSPIFLTESISLLSVDMVYVNLARSLTSGPFWPMRPLRRGRTHQLSF